MKKIILFIIIFITACNLNTTDTISGINIDIKEFAIYHNDSSQIVDFLISPIDSNKIWVINRHGLGYNLNVKDSSWENLDSQFGKYSNGIENRSLYKDVENLDLLWLGDFHGGLTIYNISSNSFTNFPQIKPVSSILFLRKYVFIGTWRGLYKVERKTLKSTKISQIAEIYVSDIEELTDDEILVNYKYKYNYITEILEQLKPTTKEICAKREVNNFDLIFFSDNTLKIRKNNIEKKLKFPCFSKDNIIIDDNTIWLPARNLKDGIIKYSYPSNKKLTIDIGYDFYNYKVVDDEEYIWFYLKNKILYFNKSNHVTKSIQLDADINNMTFDTKYLYFNTWKNIQIWSKDYIMSKAFIVKQVIDEENNFQNLLDSLDIYHINNFIDYYNSYKYIRAIFEISTNERILKKIGYLKEPIPRKLLHNYNDLNEVEDIIQNIIQENDIKASTYLLLVEMANYNGQLKQSLYFDSILEKTYPEYRNSRYQNKIQKVRKYNKIIDSLIDGNMPEDEYLWEIGNAYSELFRYVGPITEVSSTNMTFPYQFYKKLIKKYPESKYADNAAIIMFSHYEGSSHEGGDNSYNLTAIKEYKKLLKKYPDTELKPFVYHSICRLYIGGEVTFREKPKYYRLARHYAQLILKNYPDYEKRENVIYFLREIDKHLSQSLWEFKIKSNKNDYTTNEPIYIDFSLKNIDSMNKTIKIPVDNNIPSFSMIIYKYSLDKKVGGYDIMKLESNIAEYNKEFRDTIIEMGQTYNEYWDIKKTARKDLRKSPGSFNIYEEGRYFISSYCQGNFYSNLVPSNTIWITVKKE